MYKNKITTSIITDADYQKLDDFEKAFYKPYTATSNALLDDQEYLDDEDPRYISNDMNRLDRSYGVLMNSPDCGC